MTKEKVTLTLDVETLAALREALGARSLSSAVDVALEAQVARLRHMAAVDEWLAELEAEDGPIPPETQAWAQAVFADHEAKTRKREARRSR